MGRLSCLSRQGNKGKMNSFSTEGKRHCFSCFSAGKTRKIDCFPCFWRNAKQEKDLAEGKIRKINCFSCFHAQHSKQDNKDKKRTTRRTIKLFSRLKKVKKNSKQGKIWNMKRFSCFKLQRKRRLKWLRKGKGKRPRVPFIRFKNKKRISVEAHEYDAGFPKKHKSDIENHANNNLAAKNFTFKELEIATKNFKEEYLLGEGGFGRVYKGKLAKTGETVAVKQLNRDGKQGNGEFLVEVMMLSHLCHPRLVNLVGYCSEGDQRLLVYEYLSAGSLENHLLDLPPGRKPIDWSTRIKVALHAAIGLEYLHETNSPPVIYRDLKSSNILLDKDFNAKLSDFGLARLGPVGDKTHVTSRVMGTLGYCAPEYQKTGKLTVKSDVYSYGIVLLELVTGRRAVDLSRDSEELHLVRWVAPRINDPHKYSELVDPLLEGNYPRTELSQVLAIAAMCLNTKASIRPSMSDVVAVLASLEQD